MTDCYPKRAPNVPARVFDGEVIIMNPSDSALFNLNETGSAIWLAADGRTSLRQIVERDILPAFDVDPAEAFSDAAEFTRSLAAHAILLVLSEPETGS